MFITFLYLCIFIFLPDFDLISTILLLNDLSHRF
jgi:hypothetical protein